MDYKTANYLADHVMPRVSDSAFKIAFCIARYTIGWRKEWEDISLAGFQRATKIKSKNTIRRAIDELVELELIDRRRSRDRAQGFEYRLRSPADTTRTVSKSDTVLCQNLTQADAETVSNFDTHSNKKEKQKQNKSIYSKPFRRRVNDIDVAQLEREGIIHR